MRRTYRMASGLGFGIWFALVGLGCGDASFFEETESETVPVVERDDSADESDAGDQTSEETFDEEETTDEESSAELEETSVESAPEPPKLERDEFPALDRAVEARIEDARRLSVENLLETAIPHAAYIHVHSGGVLYIPLYQLQPGETEFAPAPKESPDRVVERMIHGLERAGYSSERAEELVERRREELFETHGSRVAFLAPDTWVERTGGPRLDREAAPAPPWR